MAKYHITVIGSDINPGTIFLPWKTIRKANYTLTAGDTVYIHSGKYADNIAPIHSGSYGNPITYTAHGNELVIYNTENSESILETLTFEGDNMAISTWGVDDCIRVFQTDTNHWSKSDRTRNPVWNGSSINIWGAKNEVVAFQLMIATDSTVTGMDVRLPSLANGANVIQNTSTDPKQYVGRNIELFVEHYINVTGPMDVDYLRKDAKPKLEDYVGWVPDALIPIEATSKTYANGQGGAPFTIQSGKVQGVWVDIYIPKTATAGVYTGNILVYQNGTIVSSIPVNLTVRDFTLPDETHLKTMFYGSWSNTSRHGIPQSAGKPTDWWYLQEKYKQMFHRHRMNHTWNCDLDELRTNYGQFFTGQAYTAARGYDGPGVGIGDNLCPIGIYDQPANGWVSSFSPATEAGFREASDAWEGWFQQNAPNTFRFKYMVDEPENDAEGYLGAAVAIPIIVERSNWIKNNPGIGRNLHVGVTCRLMTNSLNGTIPTLYEDSACDLYIVAGAVDPYNSYHTIYYSLETFNTPRPPGNLSLGRTVVDARNDGKWVGVYNGYRPDYSNAYMLDRPAIEQRAPGWIYYKYNVDLYFLWETAQYSDSGLDPWSNPYAHQDATMVYSGEDVLFPENSRGYHGPIASIRMKGFRRSMQDYEYLWMAKNVKGYDVTNIVKTVIPAAFDDNISDIRYDVRDSTKRYPLWEQDNYIYEAQRKALADILSGTPPVVTAPTILNNPVPLSVQVNSIATFSVNATGTQPLSYLWLRNGVAITGATQSTYSFTATLADNGSTYSCIVSNAQGTATSTAASLTVTDTPPPPPPPTGNLIKNGTFDDAYPWVFYSNAAGSSWSANGEASIYIGAPGTNIQLFQNGFPITSGKTYTFSFRAANNNGKQIEVILQEHDGPNYYNLGLDETFQLDEVMTTYTKTFTATLSCANSRLRLWMAPFAADDDSYTFDDVTLIEGVVTPPVIVPIAPQAFAASNVTVNSFVANWSSVSTATTYRLDVSAESNFASFVPGYQNLLVYGITQSVTGLYPLTTYYYRVRAENSAGPSPDSNVTSVTTLAPPLQPPQPPVALEVDVVEPEWFVAKWQPSLNATGYRIDVSTNALFSNIVFDYLNKDVGNNTTYLVQNGLVENSSYYYRIRAYNSAGASGNSNVILVTTPAKPPVVTIPIPPVSLAATNVAETSFVANWLTSPGATGYRLDVSTDSLFLTFVPSYQDRDIGDYSNTIVNGLDDGVTYYYRVRAYNSAGTSINSNITSVSTPLTPPIILPPSVPTALSATNETETTFTANWTPSVGATGYKLDVSTDETFATYLEGYFDKYIGTATECLVSGLTGNTYYYYRVRAYNEAGESIESNVMAVLTNAPPPVIIVPNPPTALPATFVTEATFIANWSTPANATGYQFDISTDINFLTFVNGYNNFYSGNVPSYGIAGLSADTTYYYRVRAYNSAGVSANSNIATVKTTAETPPEPPPTPGDMPLITQDPVSVELYSGGKVTFTVVATGTEPLRYQWRLRGMEIPGAIFPSLTIFNVTSEYDGDFFDCVVSNDVGRVESHVAAMNVLPGPAPYELVSEYVTSPWKIPEGIYIGYTGEPDEFGRVLVRYWKLFHVAH